MLFDWLWFFFRLWSVIFYFTFDFSTLGHGIQMFVNCRNLSFICFSDSIKDAREQGNHLRLRGTILAFSYFILHSACHISGYTVNVLPWLSPQWCSHLCKMVTSAERWLVTQSLYTAEHTPKSKVPKMLMDPTLKQELKYSVKQKASLELIPWISEHFLQTFWLPWQ